MKNGYATCPWAVLQHPGTDDEEIYAVCATFVIACDYVDKLVSQGSTADVVKRLPDGSITTEF